jgi:hypothetical protein
LFYRARRSSTQASEPAVRSRAWAGPASAEPRPCRRFGLLCTRFELSEASEPSEGFGRESGSASATDRLRQTERWLRGRQTGRFFRHTPGDLGVGFTGLHSICLAFLWLGLFMMGEWDGLKTGRLFPGEFVFLDGCSQGGERERESTALPCAATCGSNLSARGNCRRRRGRAFGVIFLDHLSLYYLPLLARPSCHPQRHTFAFFPWCEILNLDWRVCRLPFSYMLCIPVWRFNL